MPKWGMLQLGAIIRWNTVHYDKIVQYKGKNINIFMSKVFVSLENYAVVDKLYFAGFLRHDERCD